MGRWVSLGAVSDRAVRVWLRDPADVSQTAVLRINGEVRATARLQPDPDRDHVAFAEVQLEAPAAEEGFEVEVSGTVRTARFAPETWCPAEFSFGFGSCNQPFTVSPGGSLTKNQNAGLYPAMLDVLRKMDARFLMLLGDQIYSDEVDLISVRDLEGESAASHGERVKFLLAQYRRLYRGYFNESGYRRLLETYPSYMMWDDHDICDDWGSLQAPSSFQQAQFDAATIAFIEYQHLRNPTGSSSAGRPFQFYFWYGNTGFFVLDLRSERDVNSGVLMSDAQWRDLERFLACATASHVPTLFIGSSIPLVHFAPRGVRIFEHVPDRWRGADVRDRWSSDGFNDDRTRLLNVLFDWQDALPERQVFLLSGDVHAGAAFEVESRTGRGRIYQLTSSAFTSEGDWLQRAVNKVGTRIPNWGEKACRARRLGIEPRNNFGLVSVKPHDSGRGHEVEFRIFGYQEGLRQRVRLRMTPGANAVAMSRT